MNDRLPDDRTTDADREALKAIFDFDASADPHGFVVAVFDYYHDANRADRTPRASMYLHLGMCCGVIERLIAAQQGRSLA
jgi:hypothetical protein